MACLSAFVWGAACSLLPFNDLKPTDGPWGNGPSDAAAEATSETAAPSSAYARAVLDDSPVSYWRLEETSGTVARDEMGRHDATYEGNPAFGEPGVGGRAVLFKGRSTRLTLGDAFRFADRSSFSLECWLKPNAIASDSARFIVSRRTSTDPEQGYAIYYSVMPDSGYVLFERTVDSAPQGYAYSRDLVRDTFAHLVATFNGPSQTTRLYVNGVLAEEKASAGAIGDGSGVFAWANNGRSADSTDFQGALDELAVYDKALSPSQVSAHYAAGTR